ncbi:hypothetical protein Bbelb_048000 [Branchiostoma belcheri]|nr:hypothetical protein Bbelb_048000 [Branchiostoma belcheri]
MEDNGRKRRPPDDDCQDAKSYDCGMPTTCTSPGVEQTPTKTVSSCTLHACGTIYPVKSQGPPQSRYEEILASLDLDNINWAQDEPWEGDSPWEQLGDEVDDVAWSQLTPFTLELPDLETDAETDEETLEDGDDADLPDLVTNEEDEDRWCRKVILATDEDFGLVETVSSQEDDLQAISWSQDRSEGGLVHATRDIPNSQVADESQPQLGLGAVDLDGVDWEDEDFSDANVGQNQDAEIEQENNEPANSQQYFRIEEVRQAPNKKFNANQVTMRASIPQDGRLNDTDVQEVLHDMFDGMIGHVGRELEDNDKMRIVINSKSLDKPISTKLVNKSDMNPELILSEVEKLNEIIYKGPENEKKIIIYLCKDSNPESNAVGSKNGHCHVITTMSGFHGTAKIVAVSKFAEFAPDVDRLFAQGHTKPNDVINRLQSEVQKEDLKKFKHFVRNRIYRFLTRRRKARQDVTPAVLPLNKLETVTVFTQTDEWEGEVEVFQATSSPGKWHISDISLVITKVLLEAAPTEVALEMQEEKRLPTQNGKGKGRGKAKGTRKRKRKEDGSHFEMDGQLHFKVGQWVAVAYKEVHSGDWTVKAFQGEKAKIKFFDYRGGGQYTPTQKASELVDPKYVYLVDFPTRKLMGEKIQVDNMEEIIKQYKSEKQQRLKAIISSLNTKNVDPTDHKTYVIRRDNVWRALKDKLTKKNFDASKMVKVKFTGEEDTLDFGGPKNEMFRMALQGIFETSGLFEHSPHGYLPISSPIAIVNGDFETAGEAMAMSIVHLGPTPSCLHPAIVSALCGESLPDMSGFQPVDHKAAAFVVKLESATEVSLKDLLESDIGLNITTMAGWQKPAGSTIFADVPIPRRALCLQDLKTVREGQSDAATSNIYDPTATTPTDPAVPPAQFQLKSDRPSSPRQICQADIVDDGREFRDLVFNRDLLTKLWQYYGLSPACVTVTVKVKTGREVLGPFFGSVFWSGVRENCQVIRIPTVTLTVKTGREVLGPFVGSVFWSGWRHHRSYVHNVSPLKGGAKLCRFDFQTSYDETKKCNLLQSPEEEILLKGVVVKPNHSMTTPWPCCPNTYPTTFMTEMTTYSTFYWPTLHQSTPGQATPHSSLHREEKQSSYVMFDTGSQGPRAGTTSPYDTALTSSLRAAFAHMAAAEKRETQTTLKESRIRTEGVSHVFEMPTSTLHKVGPSSTRGVNDEQRELLREDRYAEGVMLIVNKVFKDNLDLDDLLDAINDEFDHEHELLYDNAMPPTDSFEAPPSVGMSPSSSSEIEAGFDSDASYCSEVEWIDLTADFGPPLASSTPAQDTQFSQLFDLPTQYEPTQHEPSAESEDSDYDPSADMFPSLEPIEPVDTLVKTTPGAVGGPRQDDTGAANTCPSSVEPPETTTPSAVNDRAQEQGDIHPDIQTEPLDLRTGPEPSREAEEPEGPLDLRTVIPETQFDSRKRADWLSEVSELRNEARRLSKDVDNMIRKNLTDNPPSLYEVGETVVARVPARLSRKRRTDVVEAEVVKRNTNLKYLPSIIAASAIYLARHTLHMQACNLHQVIYRAFTRRYSITVKCLRGMDEYHRCDVGGKYMQYAGRISKDVQEGLDLRCEVHQTACRQARRCCLQEGIITYLRKSYMGKILLKEMNLSGRDRLGLQFSVRPMPTPKTTSTPSEESKDTPANAKKAKLTVMEEIFEDEDEDVFDTHVQSPVPVRLRVQAEIHKYKSLPKLKATDNVPFGREKWISCPY